MDEYVGEITLSLSGRVPRYTFMIKANLGYCPNETDFDKLSNEFISKCENNRVFREYYLEHVSFREIYQVIVHCMIIYPEIFAYLIGRMHKYIDEIIVKVSGSIIFNETNFYITLYKNGRPFNHLEHKMLRRPNVTAILNDRKFVQTGTWTWYLKTIQHAPESKMDIK